MIVEKHLPLSINSDDSERLLKPSEALAIQNCRVGVSLDGKNLRVENIPSSVRVPGQGRSGDFVTIGSCVDTARNRILYALYSDIGGSAIVCYDRNSGTFYTVIFDTQLDPPGSLNFSLDKRIDRNIRVVGGLVMWTDGNGDPRCVNIDSGIKTSHPTYETDAKPYTVPTPYEDTTLIKRAPVQRLRAEKMTDASYTNNFIANEAFQFTWRYIYRDGQTSALAAYSDLINFNKELGTDDTYNFVRITVPTPFEAEIIPDEMLITELCAKYGNTGKTVIVKSWDRRNPSEEAELQSANLGNPLIYDFYNNTIGIELDDVSSVNNFDNVPISAETLEVAKNRVFLGNVVSGYDTPPSTSITGIAISTASSGVVNTSWRQTTIRTGHGSPFVFVSAVTFVYVIVNGKYYNFGLPDYLPTSVNLHNSIRTTNTWSEMCALFWTPGSNGQPLSDPANPPADAVIVPTQPVAVTIDPPVATYQFKAHSYYKLGITFFDRFRRKCGISSRDAATVNIPDRTYDTLPTANQIQWSLSNANAALEIPDWAYYYQVSITKNQVFDFFVEFGVGVGYIKYVKKNLDGTYDFTGDTFNNNETYGLGFNLYNLTNVGMGYTFSEGDLISAYRDDVAQTRYQLRVLAQEGGWIVATPVNIGSLAGTDGEPFILTLYTPYTPSSSEPFYEVSDVYKINFPTTAFAKYSFLSGILNGDVYVSENRQYMSPSFTNWMDWQRNLGWINTKDYIGQQELTTTIAFSDVFIQGTMTNGLSKFQPLNVQALTAESGDIQKLILTNKIAQDLGTVMLCICSNEPLSIYLGETQLVSTEGNAYVAQSVGVIGTINALRGNYGTLNPESVIDYLGDVFWFDIQHGYWIHYSANGANPVNHKLDSYFKQFSRRYQEQGLTDRIISCIDPVQNQLIVGMPSTEVVDYPHIIPSYDNIIPSYATTVKSQFDFYDGQQKLIYFGINDGEWRYSIGILPEWMEFTRNVVYGFRGAYIHQFEAGDTFNSFMETQLPARIAIVASQSPVDLKDLFSLSVDGNSIPDYTLGYAKYPNEQVTDLSADDKDLSGNDRWQNINGIMYAGFLKDRLSPNVNGSAEVKMYSGDYIRSIVPHVMVEFHKYDSLLVINSVDLGYQIVTGHNR